MPFCFHARYALLTYAQCDGLDPFSLSDYFSSLEAECIIAREDHADGGTHLHVFADFGKKRKFRRADCFDFGGYHPNISPSRGNAEGGWDYATKDGLVVAGGLARPSSRDGMVQSGSKFLQIIRQESEQEFWTCIRELAPELLLRNFSSLQAYARWNYADRAAEYLHPREVLLCSERLPGLDQWAECNINASIGTGR